mmetsp:Transcript_67434/g.217806  ORF Transcript_67434/g.217806 Transcript_67434/m.217806 type:complete len:318 (-) Transcript_67434:14-967(-)
MRISNRNLKRQPDEAPRRHDLLWDLPHAVVQLRRHRPNLEDAVVCGDELRDVKEQCSSLAGRHASLRHHHLGLGRPAARRLRRHSHEAGARGSGRQAEGRGAVRGARSRPLHVHWLFFQATDVDSAGLHGPTCRFRMHLHLQQHGLVEIHLVRGRAIGYHQATVSPRLATAASAEAVDEHRVRFYGGVERFHGTRARWARATAFKEGARQSEAGMAHHPLHCRLGRCRLGLPRELQQGQRTRVIARSTLVVLHVLRFHCYTPSCSIGGGQELPADQECAQSLHEPHRFCRQWFEESSAADGPKFFESESQLEPNAHH